jgi:hypothetical protein
MDATNINQVYNPETNTWITGTPIPTARYQMGCAVINDTIYVIGGREGPFGSPVSAANEWYIPEGYTLPVTTPSPSVVPTLTQIASQTPTKTTNQPTPTNQTTTIMPSTTATSSPTTEHTNTATPQKPSSNHHQPIKTQQRKHLLCAFKYCHV